MTSGDGRNFVADPGAPSGPTAVRLTVVEQESAHPLLDTTTEEWVSTVPHLLVREIAIVCLLVAFVALLSYVADAPLLDIADPSKTPNPSKAPWYFLGLQELLHYYPPMISGILLPGLVMAALMIVPYFDINIERPEFLSGAHYRRHLALVWLISVVMIVVFLVSSHAGPVWPLIGTTAATAMGMTLPMLIGQKKGPGQWIATRSLPFWIFTWFVISAIVLTVIGTFFRGPGWGFVLPWEGGLYV